MRPVPFFDIATVKAALDFPGAADAIEAALRNGVDPEGGWARTPVRLDGGELLMMPAQFGRYLTAKLVTVGGEPRIQGVAVIFDASSLAPVAFIDGSALTDLRTPAVSLVAARHMLSEGGRDKLVVFGRGPQGRGHAAAFQAEFGFREVVVLHSDSPPARTREAVRSADAICCATSAKRPLFDGGLIADSASVFAVGSHEPTARELDGGLVSRAAVVVESRRSALAEAGDVIIAGVGAERLTTLAELVAGKRLPADRPSIMKSTGMSWQDAVVASAILEAVYGP